VVQESTSNLGIEKMNTTRHRPLHSIWVIALGLTAVLILLVASGVGFLSPHASALTNHEQHDETTFCSASCEMPDRRVATTKPIDGKIEKERGPEADYNEQNSNIQVRLDERPKHEPFYRPRVDKVPIHKQISLYLD